MNDDITLTARNTAPAIEEDSDGQYTLTLLGGDGEDNVDIVGTLEEIRDMLQNALHTVLVELRK